MGPPAMCGLLRTVGAVAAAFTCATIACVRPQFAIPVAAESLSCRRLEDAERRGVDMSIAWHQPDDEKDRAALAAGCSVVGPAVLHSADAPDLTPTDRLVIASWNVHVGAADIERFVSDLRAGRMTDGEPVGDFVLLLQEAYRSSVAVPPVVPAGIDVPDRIEVNSGDRSRDIVSVARALRLNVFYVPSMRNGEGSMPHAEDRGNAIVSTRPLSDLEGIELPYVRQRRVAVSARASGVDPRGRRWTVQLVSAHLDASSGPTHLWLFSGLVRKAQAWSLLSVLAGKADPVVMGSDLNTWEGGRREPAYRAIRTRFVDADETRDGTFRWGLTLDYLFFRIPDDWHASARVFRDRFGSDHRPLVGRLALGGSHD